MNNFFKTNKELTKTHLFEESESRLAFKAFNELLNNKTHVKTQQETEQEEELKRNKLKYEPFSASGSTFKNFEDFLKYAELTDLIRPAGTPKDNKPKFTFQYV